MDQALIQRYQRGGDIYEQLAGSYGVTAADRIASAALTGDRTKVTDAIVAVKYGAPLPTSTTGLFVDQLITDPLGAPLESLNTTLGNTVLSFLKNPWVLITIALLVFFFVFNGLEILKRQAKRFA